MSKLTTKARNALPKKDFALPTERKFPIENKSHARNALARASEGLHKGNLSSSKASKIKAKANAVLKKKGVLKGKASTPAK